MRGLNLAHISLRALPSALLVLCALGLLSACASKSEDPRRPLARDIYTRNLRLLHRYTDSIAHAQDTAAVRRMMQGYDEALVRVYFSHTADVDLDITEAENDTLLALTDTLLAVRDRRLYRLAHPADTLAARTDSAAVPAPAAP